MRVVNTPITPTSEPEIWRKAMDDQQFDRDTINETYLERSNLEPFPDCMLYHMEQRSPEWFEVRRGVLTATQMGPWLTQKTKGAQKARETAICKMLSDIGHCYELPIRENDAMRRGTDLEEEAVAHFEQMFGVHIAPVGFAKSIHGRFGCSPDGLLFDSFAGFEGKAPTGAKHFEYVRAGELPDIYRYQVLGSMAVTGAKTWWFQSYHPGQPSLHVVIDRTDEVEELKAALIEFSAELETAIEEMAELWEKQNG